MSILLTRTFIIEPGRINGRSMEPSYYDNDFFMLNKFILLFREPHRGDIVQFYDQANKKYLIKRVIGLPGETVIIKQNSVYISKNNIETKLQESYLKQNTITNSDTGEAKKYQQIPENSYFLIGDNRPESTDSRQFGTIDRSFITGLVIY